MGMYGSRPATEGKHYNGQAYGRSSHKIGVYEGAKYIYDCRIDDNQHMKKGRIIVYASDYGEARWCLMGFLRCPLVAVDTNEPSEKHFVMPNDLNGNMLDVTVIRMHNI